MKLASVAKRPTRVLLSIRDWGLRALARWIPRRPNLVLFGARNGDWYMDNSQHLFEWVLANMPQVDSVWITRSKAVYRQLRREGRPVARADSPSGKYLLLRASAAVISNRLADVAISEQMIPNRVKFISLGHGQGVKGKRAAIRNETIRLKWERHLERPAQLTRYAIATSPLISRLTAESHLLPEERVVVTGYPRNDHLLDPSDAARSSWAAFLNGADPEGVLLYAPTWRQGREPTRFFPFDDFDRGELVRMLCRHRFLLLLRPHVMDLLEYPSLRESLEDLASGSDAIRLFTQHEYPDVNQFLPFVDALITDYSSIYHDFLLLDRHLIFVPYDLANFKEHNGFVYDYHENLPGPAVRTFAEFRESVKEVAAGQDPFREKRKALRDKVHTYHDSGSCERVAQLLDDMLRH